MLRTERAERAIACVARGRLDTHARIAHDFDALCRKRDATLACKRLTMREPLIGVRTETVMNMQCDATRRPRDASRGVEQYAGIDAAAERHRNARVCRPPKRCRQPSKCRADRIENEAVGGRVSGVGHGDEARGAFD